jgi:hypothetical protein
MKTRAWTNYLKSPETEARYEIDLDKGKITGARIIGYFTDESERRHEFVRWDNSHGQFHKHCLYERKQQKEDIFLTLEMAVREAGRELEENWEQYKKAYIKNHMKTK